MYTISCFLDEFFNVNATAIRIFFSSNTYNINDANTFIKRTHFSFIEKNKERYIVEDVRI